MSIKSDLAALERQLHEPEGLPPAIDISRMTEPEKDAVLLADAVFAKLASTGSIDLSRVPPGPDRDALERGDAILRRHGLIP